MIPNLRLPRGAALAAENAEGARSFAAGFWFPIGSRHEAPQERGFVHFVEHMAFKGTARRSAAELSREIERVGGYLNAFTDRDSLCLHCQVPASLWPLALDVLSDMAFCSAFAEADFEREREVIASEILSARDDPEDSSHDEMLDAIWPGDPLARKIAGEPGDLRRITRDALYGFYRTELAPERLLVTAAGPVPPAEVAAELSRLLEALPSPSGAAGGATARPDCRSASTPTFSSIRSFMAAEMEQVHFYEALQLDPPFDEADYYELEAVNGAIGEASSSRLFLSLREDKGLCYSVYSAFAMTGTECLWMASASAQPKALAELGEEMDRQLDALALDGLRSEECVDAITRLSGSFDMALEDPDFRMRRIARQVLFSGEAEEEEEARSRIASLSPARLREACVRLLRGRGRARFAYGNLSRREARASGLSPKTPFRPKAKLSPFSSAARHG
jgi:predicted Zn-dependent peptidase